MANEIIHSIALLHSMRFKTVSLLHNFFSLLPCPSWKKNPFFNTFFPLENWETIKMLCNINTVFQPLLWLCWTEKNFPIKNAMWWSWKLHLLYAVAYNSLYLIDNKTTHPDKDSQKITITSATISGKIWTTLAQ